MSRLIAFGCSHTYGHGLPDCFIPPHRPGTDPSKLSWPYPLGELLNSTAAAVAVKLFKNINGNYVDMTYPTLGNITMYKPGIPAY